MLTLLQKIVDKIKIQNRWFKLYNTVLWSGSAAEGATINVPNINEYDIILVEFYSQGSIAPILCIRHNGYIIGGQMTEGISADKYIFSLFASLEEKEGNNVFLQKLRSMAHLPSSNHNPGDKIPIIKITGLIPKK
jgi:hypothetical protein